MKLRGLLLFDIDGVIRDVTMSYRLAIQKTVKFFCNWEPTIEDIDNLKSEGYWNNDWDVSLELIKRRKKSIKLIDKMPTKEKLRRCFDNYYFGGDPFGKVDSWNGFIKNENLLVNKNFFEELSSLNISWGFVSGAERSSAKFVLEHKIGLENPPLVAMGEAPDKPNPEGFLNLVCQLSKSQLLDINLPIGYVGDTVSDVLTVMKAREIYPNLNLKSFAVSPPHLQKIEKKLSRRNYEENLKKYGADIILKKTEDVMNYIKQW